ncbi:hypothetical protein [Streptomyces sp. TRM68416]|uniref:hypothetical protein n=1 Tax=Streptomyces sp. TRM68416 TaxID=2758412 RepID=UPI001661DCB2|nr:hypothetical protein [Streptomyces sp. TRM68416]MBD0840658.1 hypothetical protein [Streptomyces sp. TRM68416]
MTPPRRRALLLLFVPLPALCALTSCGIPATGVVEAGGPAGGIAPTTRVYFVADGALVAVPRATDSPGSVEAAVQLLLQGPTDAEARKRITTRLPLPAAVPTRPATDPTDLPQALPATDTMTVTAGNVRFSVELPPSPAEWNDLAATQIICTARAAQHVADPGADPPPVTITTPDGRRVEGTGVRCPESAVAVRSPAPLR